MQMERLDGFIVGDMRRLSSLLCLAVSSLSSCYNGCSSDIYMYYLIVAGIVPTVIPSHDNLR